MKVIFFGTGTSQGIPVIGCDCEICNSLDFRDKRTRTSVFIRHKQADFVIDTGPDFRAQVLRERIQRLDAVLFTHQHRDHTAGLDEIRSFNFKQKMDIPIYGTKPVINQLKREFSYIFEEHDYPGIPRVVTYFIGNKSFNLNGLEITPILTYHYKLPVFGFRIENFTYITDANQIPDEEKAKIKGSDVLVLNALQIDKHISHFNLEEALEMIEELNPKQAYLTHISHKLGRHKDVEDQLPENVRIAYDGLKLDL